MELKETIELMESSDYKDRFKAEVYQNRIRHKKLLGLIQKAEHEELDFELTCPMELLYDQLNAMQKLDDIYYRRAKLEGVEL